MNLKEYFNVGSKPVKVVRPGPVIKIDTKWKLMVGQGLTKTYLFKKRDKRDEFVVCCLALETYRGKQDVNWTIEGDKVTVFLATPTIGLTDIVKEFAMTLDDLREDVEYSDDER